MAETVTLDIEKVANGGYSLARHEGRIVFVPFVLPGERVTAAYTQQRKNFARAHPLELIEAAPDRVEEPPCPHFGECGGCHWQHATYPRQLELKRDVVLDHFERIGKFSAVAVLPTIAAPEPWYYRNMATFQPLAEGRVGYYSHDNDYIMPIDTCLIVRPEILEALAQFDPDDDTLTRLKVQVGTHPDDVMFVIETEDDLPPPIETDLPISVNLLLSDNEPVNLIGRSHVTYTVFGRDFRVTAGGFFQANTPVAEILIEEVLRRLDLQGDETVLELFSGVGLFTAFIAQRCDLVLSVESYPPAVTDADENLADLENVDLVEGAVDEVLADLAGPFDAVVLDPPRSGLSSEALDSLLRLAPARIVYVSCDPATLARDARTLADGGYTLHEIQPVDMFPQTYHVEAVVTFERA